MLSGLCCSVVSWLLTVSVVTCSVLGLFVVRCRLRVCLVVVWVMCPLL